MFETKSVLAIIGLIISIVGALVGGNLVVEKFFKFQLFVVFFRFFPQLVQAIVPSEPAITWLATRSNRSIYYSWDIAFIYIALLPVLLILATGLWFLLIFRILNVYSISLGILIVWFLVLCYVYSVSASNQYAMEVQFKHKTANIETLKMLIIKDPETTAKRWAYFFFINWIRTPLVGLSLLLLFLFLVILFWPAWIINAFSKKTKINLEKDRSRKYYYACYSTVFIIVGLILMFLFD
jgi:hypothetical protein